MTIENLIDSLLEIAIQEDIGSGDHTSLACIPQKQKGRANLIAKDSGIIAGVEIAQKLLHKIDPSIRLIINKDDGAKINPGDIILTIEGNQQSILKSERLTLNILQRMSGIATQTGKYAEKLKGLKTKILDTRKTTPGLRVLEKMAVRIGGGVNHRMGLHDMILIKDNHIDFAGGIEQAIKRTHQYLTKKKLPLKIEIEARDLDDIKKIISIGGIDRILLDNFSTEDTSKAVSIINRKFETESSGMINLKNIRNYAECGVDYISVGALTHQIKSLDLSLKAE